MMTNAIGHHEVLERRRGDAETLDRAEHRDRRGDDPVAVEQRGAEQARGHQQPSEAPAACRRGRASASSARMPPSPRLSARMTIVRYLNVTTKLSDQKMSERMPRTFGSSTGKPVRPAEALLQRVERAGADVAVDDAQRPEGERREGPAAWAAPWPDRDTLSRPAAPAPGAGPGGARIRIDRMIAAEPTHQRQMAWMTNSSR